MKTFPDRSTPRLGGSPTRVWQHAVWVDPAAACDSARSLQDLPGGGSMFLPGAASQSSVALACREVQIHDTARPSLYRH